MLQFILGRAGSGKTKYVRQMLSEMLSKGNKNIVLIVPEQFSFESEKQMLMSVGAEKMQSIEIISFTRLADKILSGSDIFLKPRIDDGGRAVLMSMALELLDDRIKIYRKHKSSYFGLSQLLDFVREMKQCDVSFSEIDSVAEKSDGALKEKLAELSLISSAFDSLVAKKYFDDNNLLSEACKVISDNNYFSGKTVVLDAFTGFTAPEMKIIRLILQQSEKTYISLCTDSFDDKDEFLPFTFIAETAVNILSLAKRDGIKIEKNIVLNCDDDSRFKKDLSFLEKNLFAKNIKEYNGKTDNIKIFEAENMTEECRMVACEIKRLMREENCRCRDIAVFERTSGTYDRELSYMFQKYGVPYFEDSRHQIATQPLIMLVRCALKIAERGLDTDSILSILKTGMTSVGDYETSLLENYSFMWSIKGKDWKSEWKNSPNGFGSNAPDSDEQILLCLNAARQKAVKPLVSLILSFKNSTGEEKAKAIYDYLSQVNAGEQLKQLAVFFDNKNETSFALEQQRVWGVLMSVLNQLALVSEKTEISAKRFRELFEIIIAAQKLGTIPQGIDNVIIADAERSRLTEPKYLFVVGLNDGEFPLSNQRNGVLTDSERRLLCESGLNILPSSENLSAQERFIAYHALTSATSKLYLSYDVNGASGEEASASEIIENAVKLFPNIETISSNEPIGIKSVESEQSALSALSSCFNENDDFSEKLRGFFYSDEKYNGILSALTRVADSNKKDTSFTKSEISEKLFGKNMHMSASRVEEYYKCPFKYFCRYGLKVEPLKKAEVDAALSGTIIHYCLEKLLSEYGEKLSGMTALDRKNAVKSALDCFADENMGTNLSQTNKFLYNFNYHVDIICRLLDRLIEEFSVSDFMPVGFEMKIGEDGEIKPYCLNTSDGSEIRITGSIDRVDLMQKDDKSFVRVVDYKSGVKQFEKDNIYFGLNCQMLIYLFALWENGNERFPNFVPSGVLYFRANDKFVNAERYMKEKDTQKEINKTKTMSGIVLDDEAVINGMEKGTRGVFIPVTDKGKGKISLEEFNHFKNVVDKAIEDMAVSLHNGEVGIYPVNTKNYDKTCEYCDYKSVCGIDEYDEKRTQAVKGDEALG